MTRLSKWFLALVALSLLAGLTTAAVASEAKGKIKSVTADKNEFVVTDQDGKNWEFTMTEDGKIRLGDKDVKLNELKEGDEVTVTYDKKDGKLMVSEIKCKRE
jgi:Cu/Ag efflux protein CusF